MKLIGDKKCSKCHEWKQPDEFYRRSNGAKDGRQGVCKNCWEDSWGRESWVMTALGSTYGCEKCFFEPECKHNIWKKTFDPYCFVEAKYHGLYVKEYASERV